jgi:hypothetical protein
MIRHFMTAALVACATTLAPSLGKARQPAQIMAGNPSGSNVVFSFDQTAEGSGLRIETHLVGNPGAQLSIWIDHSKQKLFSRVLTTSDCKYGNDGATCRLVVDRKNSDYRRFIVAFKRGRTAHVEVQNAGVMQMSNDISLIGFAQKFGSNLSPSDPVAPAGSYCAQRDEPPIAILRTRANQPSGWAALSETKGHKFSTAPRLMWCS